MITTNKIIEELNLPESRQLNSDIPSFNRLKNLNKDNLLEHLSATCKRKFNNITQHFQSVESIDRNSIEVELRNIFQSQKYLNIMQQSDNFERLYDLVNIEREIHISDEDNRALTPINRYPSIQNPGLDL